MLATRLRGYAATRLRSCQDLPSTLKYASKEKSGHAATWLRSCQDLPSMATLEYASKEKSGYVGGYAVHSTCLRSHTF